MQMRNGWGTTDFLLPKTADPCLSCMHPITACGIEHPHLPKELPPLRGGSFAVRKAIRFYGRMVFLRLEKLFLKFGSVKLKY